MENKIILGHLNNKEVSYKIIEETFEWVNYPDTIKFIDEEFNYEWNLQDNNLEQIIDEFVENIEDKKINGSIINTLQLLESYEELNCEVEGKYMNFIYFDEEEAKSKFRKVFSCAPQKIESKPGFIDREDGDAVEIEMPGDIKVIYEINYNGGSARHTYTDAFDFELDSLVKYLEEYLDCKIKVIEY